MTRDSQLQALDRLVGTWTTEATHPAMPDVVVGGSVVIEWLEGERFLIHRARTDHPDFPDSISILGYVDRDRVGDADGAASGSAQPALRMHYYDSRGVFRDFEAGIDDTALHLNMPAPGFSQRFTGTFMDDGATIAGVWQLCMDDRNWNDDLRITYHRRTSVSAATSRS
jgi:hypothetical protein